MAHIRLSRPDAGLGVKVKALERFEGVPSSLKSGPSGLSVSVYSSLLGGARNAAVERIRYIQDSQGQILALA